MAFNFNYQPTGVGGVMTEAAKKAEEDKRRQAAIAFMLQQMGMKNELALGTEQNRISAARQESDSLTAAERLKLDRERQAVTNKIAQEQLAIEQKRLQQSYEQQHNAITLQNAQNRMQRPQPGGMFGLNETSRYQQSLLGPSSQSKIRGGIH